MISVDEALATILREAAPLATERVPIEAALGRVPTTDIVSRIDQPPFRAAAMDGYAVRRVDAEAGARLNVIGEAAAGAPFRGALGRDEAARIFTGGEVPAGADHVVIQEDVRAETGAVVIERAQGRASNIREKGIDFRAGVVVAKAGERLGAIDLAVVAAANIATVDVARKPTVAFFDNGDELVEPGAVLKAGEIVGSNRFAFAAMIDEWGGTPLYAGRARDDRKALAEKFLVARGADVVVSIGGASVGDHDHVRTAFADAGGELLFSKISVKPGKPTWFGRLGPFLALGLPGNPASAIVCAILFLRPLIAAFVGEATKARYLRAPLKGELPSNGPRQSFQRATLAVDAGGRLSATPFAGQDSSLLLPLARGNCLIRQAANSPALADGAPVDCLIYRPIS
jgi:molybdopterin molybdotransferase